MVVFFRVFPWQLCFTKYVYNHRELINIELQPTMPVTADFQQTHNIPVDIARPFGSLWVVVGPTKQRRRRRERKQKQGWRASLLTRLRQQPLKPPIPSMFLSNARSITHKVDSMELLIAANYTELLGDYCDGDAAVQLACRTLHHQDHNSEFGKKRGGTLCKYVHND